LPFQNAANSRSPVSYTKTTIYIILRQVLLQNNKVGGDDVLPEWLTQKYRQCRQQVMKDELDAVAKQPGAVACTAP